MIPRDLRGTELNLKGSKRVKYLVDNPISDDYTDYPVQGESFTLVSGRLYVSQQIVVLRYRLANGLKALDSYTFKDHLQNMKMETDARQKGIELDFRRTGFNPLWDKEEV